VVRTRNSRVGKFDVEDDDDDEEEEVELEDDFATFCAFAFTALAIVVYVLE
jgi:hypothetical protein